MLSDGNGLSQLCQAFFIVGGLQMRVEDVNVILWAHLNQTVKYALVRENISILAVLAETCEVAVYYRVLRKRDKAGVTGFLVR